METKKLPNKNKQDKYQKMLAIAYRLFLKYGYEKTSLQMIIKKTGGSLATIYKLFGNKRNLFQKAIEQENSKFFNSLEEYFRQVQQSELCLQDFLISIGKKLLNEILAPEAIALNRLIFIEGYHDSELLQTFQVSCIDKTLFCFSKCLEIYTKREQIHIQNLQEDAKFYLDLTISPYLLHSLLDSNYILPNNEETERIARKAAHIFLLYLQHNKESL